MLLNSWRWAIHGFFFGPPEVSFVCGGLFLDFFSDTVSLPGLLPATTLFSGMADFLEDYSYYSLRHTFATYRLQFGNIDVFTLSKVMGCSVKYIEEHYGQIQTDKMTDYITRTKSTFDEVDGLFLE